jgi:C1A family cysteine protease
MAVSVAKYGWLPDLPDHRDFLYEPPSALLRKLPAAVDLRAACPPVLDQGTRLGSCTANAVCNAFRFNLLKEGELKPFLPSRLFVYYNARKMAGTEKLNQGAQIRDAMKSIAVQGVCDERDWPYVARNFAEQPPRKAYRDALAHQAVRYQRLAVDLKHFQACLAQGYPFVMGLTVYADFESDRVGRTGVLNLPKPKEALVGGHAVLVVGYDNASQRFIVMNSYGKSWGQHGYFTVPYAYVMHPHLTADCWTLRRVET